MKKPIRFWNNLLNSLGLRWVEVKPRRVKRNRKSSQFEALEERVVLSVSAAYSTLNAANILTITALDANQSSIVVDSSTSGQNHYVKLLVNGSVQNIGNIPAGNVKQIVINGSSAAETLDVSRVTSANYFTGIQSTTIHGNDGDDAITGRNGSDNITGDGGDDTIVGGGGTDTVHGNAGGDTITVTGMYARAYGDADDDTLTSLASSVVSGGDGNDQITANNASGSGDAGDDTLSVSNGSISGGEGNDMLQVTSGSGSMYGGDDDDTYKIVSTANVTISEWEATGTDNLDFSDFGQSVSLDLSADGPDFLVNDTFTIQFVYDTSDMEIVTGTPFDDEIAGDGFLTIHGGAGNDRLGGGGTLYGDAGDDTLDITQTDAIIYGEDELGNETETFVNTIAYGGDGIDTFNGEASGTAFGEAGDDYFFINSGLLVCYGGTGNDFYFLNVLGQVVDATLVEELNGGTDKVQFAGNTGIAVDLGFAGIQAFDITPTHSLTLSDGSVSYAQIENVVGSSGDDIIIGNGLDNRLEGLGGNDTLRGGAGNDTLVGGTGDDYYDYSERPIAFGTDTLVEAPGEGQDLLDFFSFVGAGGIALDLSQSTVQQVLNDSSAQLSLILGGSELEDVGGTLFSDVIIGNRFDNHFYGDGGSDVYRFSGTVDQGNDTIYDLGVDSTLDLSGLDLGAGITLDLSGSDTQQLVSNDSKQLTLSGLGSIANVIGTQYADTIYGNSANNRLEGRGGDDTLRGGAGNDTLIGGTGDDYYDYDFQYGDLGTDTIEELVGGGHETVGFWNLGSSGIAVDLSLSASQQVINDTTTRLSLILGDSELEDMGGTNFSDVFTGNRFDNTFYGDGGTDIYRFAGTFDQGYDTIDDGTIDNTLDLSGLDLGVGVGVDLDPSLQSQTIVSNGTQQLTIDGLNAISNVIGTQYSDTIYGNSLNNRLEGRGGNDFLAGGDGGVDTIYGGSGRDTIYLSGLGSVGYGEDGDDLDLEATDGAFIYGGRGSDQIFAWGNATVAFGDEGNDSMYGGINATLYGGSGNDLFKVQDSGAIFGGTGDDTYQIWAWCNATIFEAANGGADVLNFANIGGIQIDLGSTSLQSVASYTTLVLSDGAGSYAQLENVVGSAGDDTILGNDLSNTIDGSGGNDFITGGNFGIDSLRGGSGADHLESSSPFSQLSGGDGNDVLILNQPLATVQLEDDGDTVWGATSATVFEPAATQPFVATISGPSSGSVSDPYVLTISAQGSDLSAIRWEVNWGDSNSDAFEQLSPAALSASHSYSSSGTFSISVRAIHGQDRVYWIPLTVSIRPTINIALPPNASSVIDPSALQSFDLTAVGGPVDEWTVDWGDTSQPQTIPGNATTASHRFLTLGEHQIYLSAVQNGVALRAAPLAIWSAVPTSVNTAPTLNDTHLIAALVSQANASLNRGISVGDLTGGVVDPDPFALHGIAVVDALTANNYSIQYSLDNGNTWQDIGQVSQTAALLLPESARVRLYAISTVAGPIVQALEFYAWDQAEGSAGDRLPLTGLGTAVSTTSDTLDFVKTNGSAAAPVIANLHVVEMASVSGVSAPTIAGQATSSIGSNAGILVEYDFNHDGIADGHVYTDATNESGDFVATLISPALQYGLVTVHFRASMYDPGTLEYLQGEWINFSFQNEAPGATLTENIADIPASVLALHAGFGKNGVVALSDSDNQTAPYQEMNLPTGGFQSFANRFQPNLAQGNSQVVDNDATPTTITQDGVVYSVSDVGQHSTLVSTNPDGTWDYQDQVTVIYTSSGTGLLENGNFQGNRTETVTYVLHAWGNAASSQYTSIETHEVISGFNWSRPTTSDTSANAPHQSYGDVTTQTFSLIGTGSRSVQGGVDSSSETWTYVGDVTTDYDANHNKPEASGTTTTQATSERAGLQTLHYDSTESHNTVNGTLSKSLTYAYRNQVDEDYGSKPSRQVASAAPAPSGEVSDLQGHTTRVFTLVRTPVNGVIQTHSHTTEITNDTLHYTLESHSASHHDAGGITYDGQSDSTTTVDRTRSLIRQYDVLWTPGIGLLITQQDDSTMHSNWTSESSSSLSGTDNSSDSSSSSIDTTQGSHEQGSCDYVYSLLLITTDTSIGRTKTGLSTASQDIHSNGNWQGDSGSHGEGSQSTANSESSYSGNDSSHNEGTFIFSGHAYSQLSYLLNGAVVPSGNGIYSGIAQGSGNSSGDSSSSSGRTVQQSAFVTITSGSTSDADWSGTSSFSVIYSGNSNYGPTGTFSHDQTDVNTTGSSESHSLQTASETTEDTNPSGNTTNSSSSFTVDVTSKSDSSGKTTQFSDVTNGVTSSETHSKYDESGKSLSHNTSDSSQTTEVNKTGNSSTMTSSSHSDRQGPSDYKASSSFDADGAGSISKSHYESSGKYTLTSHSEGSSDVEVLIDGWRTDTSHSTFSSDADGNGKYSSTSDTSLVVSADGSFSGSKSTDHSEDWGNDSSSNESHGTSSGETKFSSVDSSFESKTKRDGKFRQSEDNSATVSVDNGIRTATSSHTQKYHSEGNDQPKDSGKSQTSSLSVSGLGTTTSTNKSNFSSDGNGDYSTDTYFTVSTFADGTSSDFSSFSDKSSGKVQTKSHSEDTVHSDLTPNSNETRTIDSTSSSDSTGTQTYSTSNSSSHGKSFGHASTYQSASNIDTSDDVTTNWTSTSDVVIDITSSSSAETQVRHDESHGSRSGKDHSVSVSGSHETDNNNTKWSKSDLVTDLTSKIDSDTSNGSGTWDRTTPSGLASDHTDYSGSRSSSGTGTSHSESHSEIDAGTVLRSDSSDKYDESGTYSDSNTSHANSTQIVESLSTTSSVDKDGKVIDDETFPTKSVKDTSNSTTTSKIDNGSYSFGNSGSSTSGADKDSVLNGGNYQSDSGSGPAHTFSYSTHQVTNRGTKMMDNSFSDQTQTIDSQDESSSYSNHSETKVNGVLTVDSSSSGASTISKITNFLIASSGHADLFDETPDSPKRKSHADQNSTSKGDSGRSVRAWSLSSDYDADAKTYSSSSGDYSEDYLKGSFETSSSSDGKTVRQGSNPGGTAYEFIDSGSSSDSSKGDFESSTISGSIQDSDQSHAFTSESRKETDAKGNSKSDSTGSASLATANGGPSLETKSSTHLSVDSKWTSEIRSSSDSSTPAGGALTTTTVSVDKVDRSDKIDMNESTTTSDDFTVAKINSWEGSGNFYVTKGVSFNGTIGDKHDWTTGKSKVGNSTETVDGTFTDTTEKGHFLEVDYDDGDFSSSLSKTYTEKTYKTDTEKRTATGLTRTTTINSDGTTYSGSGTRRTENSQTTGSEKGSSQDWLWDDEWYSGESYTESHSNKTDETGTGADRKLSLDAQGKDVWSDPTNQSEWDTHSITWDQIYTFDDDWDGIESHSKDIRTASASTKNEYQQDSKTVTIKQASGRSSKIQPDLDEPKAYTSSNDDNTYTETTTYKAQNQGGNFLNDHLIPTTVESLSRSGHHVDESTKLEYSKYVGTSQFEGGTGSSLYEYREHKRYERTTTLEDGKTEVEDKYSWDGYTKQKTSRNGGDIESIDGTHPHEDASEDTWHKNWTIKLNEAGEIQDLTSDAKENWSHAQNNYQNDHVWTSTGEKTSTLEKVNATTAHWKYSLTNSGHDSAYPQDPNFNYSNTNKISFEDDFSFGTQSPPTEIGAPSEIGNPIDAPDGTSVYEAIDGYENWREMFVRWAQTAVDVGVGIIDGFVHAVIPDNIFFSIPYIGPVYGHTTAYNVGYVGGVGLGIAANIAVMNVAGSCAFAGTYLQSFARGFNITAGFLGTTNPIKHAIEGNFSLRDGVQLVGSLFQLLSSVRTWTCFTPETLVATATGQRPIAEIQVGDEVWAMDVVRGRWALKPVLETLVFDHPHDIVEIKAGGQVLRSTEGHPFWVIEGEGLARRPKPEHIVKAELEGTTVPGRWVDSHDLLVGDVLLLKDGKPTRISEIRRVGYSGQVHNLTVADYNNYAIGDVGVLVHNSDCVKGRELDPTKENVYRGGTSVEARLRDVKIVDGLVQTSHGVSLNIDPSIIPSRFIPTLIKSIPDGLKIIQRGDILSHFEIVPRVAMTFEAFQELLRKVIL